MNPGHAIGVDVGGTKILSGVVDGDGAVRHRHEVPTPTGSQDELLAALDEAVEAVLDDEVVAIGFGIPSTIDQRTGRVVMSVNIPFSGIDLRGRTRERFGRAAAIENDAAAAAIGEWRAGGGRGTTDMVMLTLGTGVGGGMILGGRPYRGWIGAGGELGHMVIEYDGPPCQGACTGRGHLEALVSGHAATLRAPEAFGPAADAHRLVRLADEGDATARGILDDIGRRLGAGLGTIVNAFQPELIVLGGGFGIAAWEYLVPPAREVLAREALEPGRDLVRVERAQLGTTAGVVGAAFVALDALG